MLKSDTSERGKNFSKIQRDLSQHTYYCKGRFGRNIVVYIIIIIISELQSGSSLDRLNNAPPVHSVRCPQ